MTPSPDRVPWRDLTHLTPTGRVRELLLPLPWLILALADLGSGWVVFTLVGSFYFYLLGLRLVHDVFHGNLGLPRGGNDAVLLVLSGLMLGSMHAVRLTHLEHHRDCLGPADTEGDTARRTAFGALLWGPLFPVRLHLAALRLAPNRQRRWVAAELALNLGWLPILATTQSPNFGRFFLTMLLAQALSGFFAVWTVHHDCDRWDEIARTLRHRFKSLLVFNMFYHLEHHLYPRVPTCRLPTLARRLDTAFPNLPRKPVY